MKSKTFFEIPVYSMSPQDYALSSQSAKKPWAYNNIIGYVTISCRGCDTNLYIEFDIYGQKTAGGAIEQLPLEGYRFYATDLQEGWIRTNIHSMLERIEKECFPAGAYADSHIFDNSFKWLNMHAIVNSMYMYEDYDDGSRVIVNNLPQYKTAND
ncbi:MAG: hypothetical protein LUE97_08820 [Oscillospiraceae bacterium]|nr:hypothetical protein [Oscillospiraceae bacterium]MCD8066972.1 hypothetical protein [Oscillospiraceae bacterium]